MSEIKTVNMKVMSDLFDNITESITDWFVLTEEEVVEKFRSLPKAQVLEVETTQGPAVFVPGTRKDRVLLVAHYDTVFSSYNNLEIDLLYRNGLAWSDHKTNGIGADNRAGVAALWTLRKTGHSLLIVPEEETGCKGSRYVATHYADQIGQHQFMIQFDRKNSRDLVTYQCKNTKFEEHLENFFPDYSVEPGSYTDIVHLMPALKIAGVNISIGFRKEHTKHETFDLFDWFRTLTRVYDLLTVNNIPSFKYKEASSMSHKIRSRLSADNLLDDDDANYSYYSRNHFSNYGSNNSKYPKPTTIDYTVGDEVCYYLYKNDNDTLRHIVKEMKPNNKVLLQSMSASYTFEADAFCYVKVEDKTKESSPFTPTLFNNTNDHVYYCASCTSIYKGNECDERTTPAGVLELLCPICNCLVDEFSDHM